MADLLIRGLRMPLKNEEPVHLTINEDGRVIVGGSYTIYRAVEIPDHGRLIDADVVLADIRPDESNDEHWAATGKIIKQIMRNRIESAPTIIPASKEGA